MREWKSFEGVITNIEKFHSGDDCTLFFTVRDQSGAITNFYITPRTYVIDAEMLRPGDVVTAWYDATKPAILIYPPQFEAVAIGKNPAGLMMKADYFDNTLTSSDGMLQLRPSQQTEIIQTNGQIYPGNPANHFLIAIYGPSTKSIPAQTVPERIIVFCN